jgi:hypothetical protein
VESEDVGDGRDSILTDEKGRKTAAVIDLKVHKALWEDIQDVLVSKARRREKGVSLDKVKAGLIASGSCVGKYSVELKVSARKELGGFLQS